MIDLTKGDEKSTKTSVLSIDYCSYVYMISHQIIEQTNHRKNFRQRESWPEWWRHGSVPKQCVHSRCRERRLQGTIFYPPVFGHWDFVLLPRPLLCDWQIGHFYKQSVQSWSRKPKRVVRARVVRADYAVKPSGGPTERDAPPSGKTSKRQKTKVIYEKVLFLPCVSA